MTEAYRLMPTDTHRTDVFAGERRIGYVVRMLEGLGATLDGERVEYFVSPERGGLKRAMEERKALADSLSDAVRALAEMDEAPP